ncbi:thioesterase domain-containing protein, partial [uncultured Algibacter sp.]|uniref:thioesterase domain-containing protein n=1 Tax=uncultured Algibacter sp. TaxID=298659 RepID=UPI00262A648A
MANDFVKEIKAVSPKGPYHIMGYCFNTAVALEICRILKIDNQLVHLIITDTIAINENRTAPAKTKRRVKGFFSRLSKNPLDALYRYLEARIERYIKPFIARNLGSSLEKNIQKLRDNLNSNYLNYEWIPFDIHISLMITEKEDPTYNPEIIESWNALSEKKKVKITRIKGTHRQVFRKPTVKNTAKDIENCMEYFENNNIDF